MKQRDLVIAIDCSTTASKAVVWDYLGNLIAIGRQGYDLQHVKSGWVEQNANDWWIATSTAITNVVKQIDPNRIAALAITHQRETFVCLDEYGEPVRPAMTWMDIRATEEVASYGTPQVHRLTGKPPNPTPAWYKLLWLKKYEAENLTRTRRVVDVGGYLIQKLTGQWATSWASADPLGLVNLSTFTYDPYLVSEAGISENQLPRLVAPGKKIGELKAEIAKSLGLPDGLTVVAGAGDGQSAGLGCNVTRPGRAYLNLGTGAVSGVYGEGYRYDTSYRTMGGSIPGSYIFETFIGGGTLNISWFVENFGSAEKNSIQNQSVEQIFETAASTIAPGADKLLCLPYWSGAMTPYWDGNARGAFVGLAGLHSKAHMYRAILEGIAFEQRFLTEGVEKATGTPIEEIIILGGGSSSPLWCQIIADVMGRKVKIVREQETTSLGAGIHAAAAVGLHSSLIEAADRMTGVEREYHPRTDIHSTYSSFFVAYCSLYPNLKASFSLLSKIT
jgi:xylulokinase